MSIVDTQRVRVLKPGRFVGKSVLYWMSREKRADDNWSLIFAQEIAIKNNVPLLVCFQYLGKFQDSNIRQYAFLFKGLIQLKKRLDSLNIEFLFLQGSVQKTIPKLVEERSIGTIIVDYSPLKIYKARIKKVINKIDIPLLQFHGLT